MKYSELKERHNALEKDVFNALMNEIEESERESEHVQEKALPVNIFGYAELVVLSGELTFIDDGGYQYSVYADCSLEDLIDILSLIE